jgi:glycosyltransferase involved in cell wall biosynthesis
MKVAMLAYAFYEGNARIQQYTKALVEQGHCVDVFALRRDGEPAYAYVDGVHVYGIQKRSIDERLPITYLYRVLQFLIKSLIIVAKKHISSRYALVHVHSVPDFLVSAAAVPKLFGASVILDIHDILPEFYASKFGTGEDSLLFKMLVVVEKWSAAFADHVIIANDLWRRRLLGRSVAGGKCTAISNYPNSRVFRPNLRSRADRDMDFVMLYPGTLNWHQGLDVAIEAFAIVARQIPDAQFRIFGEGPTKSDLIRLSKELGLTGKVMFHSMVPLEQIATEMANADVAVVPKRASSPFGTEAASTKILEFMSVGVPVLVSKTKIDSYYHSDRTVMFFESENPESLADAILTIRSNDALRRSLVENAGRYARENCWDAKKGEYIGLVTSLIRSTVNPSDQHAHASF